MRRFAYPNEETRGVSLGGPPLATMIFLALYENRGEICQVHFRDKAIKDWEAINLSQRVPASLSFGTLYGRDDGVGSFISNKIYHSLFIDLSGEAAPLLISIPLDRASVTASRFDLKECKACPFFKICKGKIAPIVLNPEKIVQSLF